METTPIRVVAKQCIRPGWVMICKAAPNEAALCTQIVPIGGPDWTWSNFAQKWIMRKDHAQLHLDALDRVLNGIGAMKMGYPMMAPEEIEFIKSMRPDAVAVAPAIEFPLEGESTQGENNDNSSS